MVKVNRKRLKTVLTLGVRNFGPSSIALKLSKFPLFDDFFSDLADFWDLNNFLVFNNFQDLDNFPVFDNFPFFLINSSPPSTPPTSLAASTSLATNTYNDKVVFSIDISGAAILLKS